MQLPNQWSLKPAGRHVEVGDFPVNIAIHPTGEFAAVLCAGYREHEVIDRRPQPRAAAGRVARSDRPGVLRPRVLARRQASLRQRRRVRGRPRLRLRPRLSREGPADRRERRQGRHARGGRRDQLRLDRARSVRGGAVGRRGRARAARQPGQQEGHPDGRDRRRRRSRGRANRRARRTAARKTKDEADDRSRRPKDPEFYPYTCLAEPGGKRCVRVPVGAGRRSRSSTWRRTRSSRRGRPPSTRPRWCSRRRATRCTSRARTRRR